MKGMIKNPIDKVLMSRYHNIENGLEPNCHRMVRVLGCAEIGTRPNFNTQLNFHDLKFLSQTPKYLQLMDVEYASRPYDLVYRDNMTVR